MRPPTRSPLRHRLIPPSGLVVLWLLASSAGWPGPRALPSLGAFLRVAVEELSRGELWRDLGATLARLGAGLGIATLIGAPLGLLLGRDRRVWRSVEGTVDFVRAVPPILAFPLFLLALGYGERARVAAVVFGTTGILMLHIAAGLARAPSARADVVRLAGLRGLDAFLHLHLYESLPALFTGLRVALAAGLVIAVVTEMLVGADHGLGVRALSAQLSYRVDLLWLVILLSGSVGYALSGGLAALERRVVRWR